MVIAVRIAIRNPTRKLSGEVLGVGKVQIDPVLKGVTGKFTS
jgi:hypothetical protein